MSGVVKTIIDDWMVPRMNCHSIAAAVFYENEASLAVFRKNGFSVVGEQKDIVTLPIERGGESKGGWLLERLGDTLETRGIL